MAANVRVVPDLPKKLLWALR